MKRIPHLALILVVAVLAPSVLHGDSIKIQGNSFADSDANYIFTGTFKYENQWHERYHFGMKAVVDAISSATVQPDAVSGASSRNRGASQTGFVGGYSQGGWSGLFDKQPNSPDKFRQEISANAGAEISESAVSAGYIYSNETYYKSHTIYGTFLQNFAMRNTILSATYYHNFDSVSSEDDAIRNAYDYPKSKDVNSVSLSLTQILTKWTIAQATISWAGYSGHLIDPKREVYMYKEPTAGGLGGTTPVQELLPASRNRYAGSIRLNQYLWKGSSLQTGYRYYDDDWDISSNTVEAEWFQYASPWVLFRFHGRYYSQSESKYFMFQATNGVDEFYTASPLLQKFDSRLVGGRIQIIDQGGLSDKVQISGGVGADYYTQSSRSALPDGHQAMIGVANIMALW